MFIKRFALITLLAIGVIITQTSFAQEETSGYLMTETEKQAIQEIVRDYIKNNPEEIVKAIEESSLEKAKKQREGAEKIKEIPQGLYDNAPAGGDENAEITIVEFFDYNCGYCKRVINDVNRLVDDPDSIKVVFRELPILSDSSEMAAQFALAADKQGKYLEMHTKFMQHRGRIAMEDVEKYAEELNLDFEKLKADADSQDIIDAIATNMGLARDLGVRGTPFFLVGKRKVPGAVGYTRLKSIIEEEKAKAAGGA